jgi:PilZ domain
MNKPQSDKPKTYSSAASSSALSESDRRAHARYSVQVPIEIMKDGSDLPMRLETSDLSRGGCYVRLETQFPLGVRVRTTLWLDDYPVTVRGLIATRHPQFGNGIMFMEFEGNGEQILSRYLGAIIT